MREQLKNQELSDEERLLRGKKYAMHLLERRDYSRKELTEKLRKSGYENEVLAGILAYLDSYHYLDDVRYAGMLIRSRKTVKSRKELLFYLKTKGISDEDIEVAMEANYHMREEYSSLCLEKADSNIDGLSEEEWSRSPEMAAIQKQLRKYHITEETLCELEYEEKQKIAAKLYRRGYAKDSIRKTLHL